MDWEVVLKELLGPADTTKAQIFCIQESKEVIMVNKNEDLIFATFQVMAPSLKSFNNNKKLLIVSLIPSLSENHFWKKKDYLIPSTNFGFVKIWIMIFMGHMIGKKLI